jgi:hypothetical protein
MVIETIPSLELIDRPALDTMRLSLVRIGGRVRELLTKIRLHMVSGHPGRGSWYALPETFDGVHE